MLTKGGGESPAPQDPSGYALVTSFCSTIRKIQIKKKSFPSFPTGVFPPYHRADSQFISILAWLQLYISKLCGVGALFMWPHCNILGKMFKAEFWLFTDKIYVYLCSKWVLYHTAVKLGLVLVPIRVGLVWPRSRKMRSSHREVSLDFGPSSESFSLASWVLWGLLNKFDNDLACQIKLLLHFAWNLFCLAQILHAIKADTLVNSFSRWTK